MGNGPCSEALRPRRMIVNASLCLLARGRPLALFAAALLEGFGFLADGFIG